MYNRQNTVEVNLSLSRALRQKPSMERGYISN